MAATVASIREPLSATKRIVAYYPMLAEISGGVTAALMLSQGLYWAERAKGEGWFFKSREEWKVETGLTRDEQETARRKLRDRGLLRERLAGNPRRLFFCVDLERVAIALAERLSPVAGFPPEENLPASRRENNQQVGGKATTLVAENHPPKTSETSRDYAQTKIETSDAAEEKSPSAKNLALLLKAEILNNKPDYRLTPKNLRDWQTTADRMIRGDNRTELQIAAVIRFSQADSFWKATALSMDSIRKNFDQLELKARSRAALGFHGKAANARPQGNGIGPDRNLDRYTKGLPGVIVARANEDKAQ